MKKIIYASLLTGILSMGFASCEDDNDSNPTVQQPTGFELNEPALVSNVYDLAGTDSIRLTYDQPDYGYTASINYYAQVSLTNKWEAPATEDAPANFAELEGYVNTPEYKMSAQQLNRAILELGGYDEATTPESTSLYVRMRATLNSGYECYSDVITLNVAPYYMELTNADPELWYLVGGCIGDGSWTNGSTSDVGISLIPMNTIAGYEYHASTGKGMLTYTGYFPASGIFKLIQTPGAWDNQWGNSGGDGIDNFVKNDGGSSNLKVPADGYYTITLDTQNDVLTIVATDAATEYTDMYITGDFASWAETEHPMNAVNTTADMAGHNHDWYFDLDATGGDTTAKFLQPGWSPNWGATEFPYGIGVNNGANIPVAAGNYRVVFNDITGYYHFYSK